MAVKAVQRSGWDREVASSAVSYVILLVLLSCLVIAVLSLLGPAINPTFSNIIQQLETPVPWPQRA